MPTKEEKREHRKSTAHSLINRVFNRYFVPDPKYVLGIDTSHWTGIVDWKKAYAAGVRFAFIKFMDGIGRTQYAFENFVGAKEAGVLVGSYQWMYPDNKLSVFMQVERYAEMLSDLKVDIPAAVDFEWGKDDSYNPRLSDLDLYVTKFHAAVGYEPMLYTAPGYWQEYGATSYRQNKPLRLWLANYGVSEPAPLMPWAAHMHPWDFWQVSEDGEGAKYGVDRYGEREIDMNYWRGTMEDLLRYCGKDATPQPVPLPIPEPAPEPSPPAGYSVFDHTGIVTPTTARCYRLKLRLKDYDIVIDDRVAVASTLNFAIKKGVDWAINGLDGYYTTKKWGRWVTELVGPAAYRGKLFGGKPGASQTLYFSEDNKVSLERPSKIWNAVSFPNLLVKDGVVQKINKDKFDIRARTAFGVDKAQEYMYILVVDGGDYWSNKGLSVHDVAHLMAKWCDLAVLGDSGGSTTLVERGIAGHRVVNKPSGENADGQRSVAIHMGFTRRL